MVLGERTTLPQSTEKIGLHRSQFRTYKETPLSPKFIILTMEMTEFIFLYTFKNVIFFYNKFLLNIIN